MSETNGTYSARSRFRPTLFPNEDGARSDELPPFVTRQPSGDQWQDPPSDSFKDDLAVASVPDANVGQCRSLHRLSVRYGRGGSDPETLFI